MLSQKKFFPNIMIHQNIYYIYNPLQSAEVMSQNCLLSSSSHVLVTCSTRAPTGPPSHCTPSLPSTFSSSSSCSLSLPARHRGMKGEERDGSGERGGEKAVRVSCRASTFFTPKQASADEAPVVEEELEWEVLVPLSRERGIIGPGHSSGPSYVEGGSARVSREDSPVCTSGEEGLGKMYGEDSTDRREQTRILGKEVSSKSSAGKGSGKKSVLTSATFHWSGIPKMAVDHILPN